MDCFVVMVIEGEFVVCLYEMIVVFECGDVVRLLYWYVVIGMFICELLI